MLGLFVTEKASVVGTRIADTYPRAARSHCASGYS
jgi:hypothetical protein